MLIVPPANRDSKTKERMKPHSSAEPEPMLGNERDAPTPPPKRPLPPMSVLLPTSPLRTHENDARELPDLVSSPRVPLYNGVPLFPTRPTRAALHKQLCELLTVEARARYCRARAAGTDEEGCKEAKNNTQERAKGDQKASHAFLLCSSADTVARADVVPLAVALWRLRVWSGEQWAEQDGTWATVV